MGLLNRNRLRFWPRSEPGGGSRTLTVDGPRNVYEYRDFVIRENRRLRLEKRILKTLPALEIPEEAEEVVFQTEESRAESREKTPESEGEKVETNGHGVAVGIKIEQSSVLGEVQQFVEQVKSQVSPQKSPANGVETANQSTADTPQPQAAKPKRKPDARCVIVLGDGCLRTSCEALHHSLGGMGLLGLFDAKLSTFGECLARLRSFLETWPDREVFVVIATGLADLGAALDGQLRHNWSQQKISEDFVDKLRTIRMSSPRIIALSWVTLLEDPASSAARLLNEYVILHPLVIRRCFNVVDVRPLSCDGVVIKANQAGNQVAVYSKEARSVFPQFIVSEIRARFVLSPEERATLEARVAARAAAKQRKLEEKRNDPEEIARIETERLRKAKKAEQKRKAKEAKQIEQKEDETEAAVRRVLEAKQKAEEERILAQKQESEERLRLAQRQKSEEKRKSAERRKSEEKRRSAERRKSEAKKKAEETRRFQELRILAEQRQEESRRMIAQMPSTSFDWGPGCSSGNGYGPVPSRESLKRKRISVLGEGWGDEPSLVAELLEEQRSLREMEERASAERRRAWENLAQRWAGLATRACDLPPSAKNFKSANGH